MSDALLVIDPQNDFCEGGRLAVAGGAGIMPLINRLSARFDRVIVTQDWHTPTRTRPPSSKPSANKPRQKSAPSAIATTGRNIHQLGMARCRCDFDRRQKATRITTR